jgi:glycosyltransferase involved in cell wall biosynthesis
MTTTSSSVSVLIPVYNRQDLIGPCIQSALDQTLSPLEIVVVDNASTDATWAVCQSYAQRDERVRIFRNASNIGPVRNWQRCIEEARGEYGKLLFSDDLIYPDYLARTAPLLTRSDVGFVYSAVMMGPEPDAAQVANQWTDHAGVFPAADYIEAALKAIIVPFSPGAAVFRLRDLQKNLVLSIPGSVLTDFPDHGAGPDLLLSLLTAQEYPCVAHLFEPLAFFRAHAQSISTIYQGWYIYRRYQQARIWFAAETRRTAALRELLAGMWLSECRNEHRWIAPAKCIRQYTDRPVWSWRVVARLFASRLRAVIQRRYHV